MAERPNLIGGRFAPVELLGRGGFAEVWLADDLEAGQRVVLKLVQGDHQTPEATAGEKLAHPNIARLLDWGVCDERSFLVFEHTPGVTVRAHLEAAGRMPAREVSELARSIGSALDFCHGRGFLHNDLKPENILVCDDGRSLLLDFGSSVSLRETRSIEDAAVFTCTLDYVAPEVVRGAIPTRASDIYSFAVLLFECLTGELPARVRRGGSDESRMAAGRQALERAGVGRNGAAAMLAALSEHPSLRPGSAAELAVALAGVRTTVVLERPGPASPPVHRHRLLVPVAAVLLLAGLAAMFAAASSRDLLSGPESPRPDPTGVALEPGQSSSAGPVLESTPTPQQARTGRQDVPPNANGKAKGKQKHAGD